MNQQEKTDIITSIGIGAFVITAMLAIFIHITN